MTQALPVVLWMGLGAGCGGTGPLLRDDAAMIAGFRAEHAAIYAIYAARPDRDALHAALSRAFVGEALTQQYVAHFQTLAQLDADGIRVEVQDVSHQEVTVQSSRPGEVELAARWTVQGQVDHRGHRHVRRHGYDARFTLVATRDGWRISAVRPGRVERLPVPATPTGEPLRRPLDLLDPDGP